MFIQLLNIRIKIGNSFEIKYLSLPKNFMNMCIQIPIQICMLYALYSFVCRDTRAHTHTEPVPAWRDAYVETGSCSAVLNPRSSGPAHWSSW